MAASLVWRNEMAIHRKMAIGNFSVGGRVSIGGKKTAARVSPCSRLLLLVRYSP
jgi:hypothetical protein